MNNSGISSKLFVLGIVFGVVGGIVVGSILGMQLGEKSVGYLKTGLKRIGRQKPSVRFDLLLQ